MNDLPVSTETKPCNKILLYTCLILIVCLLVFAFVISIPFPIGHRCSPKEICWENLHQVYRMMIIYQMTYHTYPSMQPKNTMYTKGGGVRDLYPLYSSRIMNKDSLSLLRPPGCSLIPFSSNPGPDEFDSKHIGYSYNSTVVPDDASNPPLMAERGAADGKLTKEEKPVCDGGVHVLMCNGQVKWIRASRDGVLQIEGITTTNELAKLLE